MKREAIAGWRRFTAPYYVASALLVASYALTRQWWLLHGERKYARMSPAGLSEKEMNALMLLGVALAVKFWRRLSMDAFLSDALTYFKSAVCLMVFYMDWRICIYYLLLIMVFYLLFPQPLFKGPSALEHFTPASFRTMVEEDAQADACWLVEFFAPWAPPCIHLEPVVAELSLTYTTDKLRFGKVDASRWPQLAKQHKVEVYGAISHLPTFIMFRQGKELGRIPHVYEDGQVAGGKFRRQDIVVAFSLDDFLEAGDSSKGGAAAAGGAKGSSKAGGGGGSTKKRR